MIYKICVVVYRFLLKLLVIVIHKPTEKRLKQNSHTSSPLNYSKNLFSKLWSVQMISPKKHQTVVGKIKISAQFAHNADEVAAIFDVGGGKRQILAEA